MPWLPYTTAVLQGLVPSLALTLHSHWIRQKAKPKLTILGGNGKLGPRRRPVWKCEKDPGRFAKDLATKLHSTAGKMSHRSHRKGILIWFFSVNTFSAPWRISGWRGENKERALSTVQRGIGDDKSGAGEEIPRKSEGRSDRDGRTTQEGSGSDQEAAVVLAVRKRGLFLGVCLIFLSSFRQFIPAAGIRPTAASNASKPIGLRTKSTVDERRAEEGPVFNEIDLPHLESYMFVCLFTLIKTKSLFLYHFDEKFVWGIKGLVWVHINPADIGGIIARL